MSAMRLLLVNVFFAPQMIGGATRVVADNLRDFRTSGAFEDIAVFCTLNGGQHPHMMRTYARPEGPVFATAAQILPNIDFLVHDAQMRERFESVLDYFQPDLIHFHCIQRMTSDVVQAALDREIPYVITMHDGWWISDRQFLVNDAGEIETYDYSDPAKTNEAFGALAVERQGALKTVLDGAARLLTVSSSFKRVLASAGLENVDVTPNGVSPIDELDKQPSRKVTLGYLAGIAHYKGFHAMRAAFMRGAYENVRLIVVDHALQQGQMVKEQWGATEVERIGFTPQDQVARLYQRLNVVIVPSIWPESFGLVAREALQSRSWLLASSRGAAAEDVQEGRNGHVFDPGDRTDFDRVLGLVNDNAARYRQPAAKIDIAQPSDQARQLERIYRHVLSNLTS